MQSAIIDLCRLLGYLVYHDNDPRRNVAGFPDLIILGFGVLIILELKTDRNQPTKEQLAWLEGFQQAGVDARVYRTSEWQTMRLADELKRIKRAWLAKD